MRIIDFEYNGERLSDYGLMPCFIDSAPSEVVEVGNSVVINKVKAPNTQKYVSTNYSYEDVLSVSFQVCKIGCDVEAEYISDYELNKIMRWLNRKAFYIFKPIYDISVFDDVYFEGTFNVKPIYIANNIVGLDLVFTSNAPYGFIEKMKYNIQFEDSNDKYVIYDSSDEIGNIYCDVVITCLEGGDLNISNSLDAKNDVDIKNCAAGEIISIKGYEKIISSSLEMHDTLPNDFNYNFLRICNTYERNDNVLTCSMKCKIEISYSPIRKVGIII